MTRKWVLSAAVIAAGLFAVGCGQVSEATKKGTEASKAAGEKAKEEVGKAKEGVDKLAAVADAAKAAVADLNKEVEPLTKKLGEIEKSMTAEKDAGKKAELSKLFTGGTEKLKEITDMIKSGFAPEKLKDLASSEAVAKLKETVLAKIAELKKTLGL